MKLVAFRDDLPDWVKENMMAYCSYCGAYIVDNSDTGVTTSRQCINPRCPGHMQHRAKVLADYFNIKGFGPKTAYKEIVKNNMKTHFEFLPKWFPDSKPVVRLSDIATLACIEGYGETTAKQELNRFKSFTEYFNTCYYPNPALLEHKDELIEAEQYFIIKPPLSNKTMLVMGTGSFHGYNNRDEFFRYVNDQFGQYVNVIQTGKRKTGVSYLIKEVDAVDHSKSRIAHEYGIPIVTPQEFISYLSAVTSYNDSE